MNNTAQHGLGNMETTQNFGGQKKTKNNLQAPENEALKHGKRQASRQDRCPRAARETKKGPESRHRRLEAVYPHRSCARAVERNHRGTAPTFSAPEIPTVPSAPSNRARSRSLPPSASTLQHQCLDLMTSTTRPLQGTDTCLESGIHFVKLNMEPRTQGYLNRLVSNPPAPSISN